MVLEMPPCLSTIISALMQTLASWSFLMLVWEQEVFHLICSLLHEPWQWRLSFSLLTPAGSLWKLVGWLSSFPKLLLDSQLHGCFCFLGPYLLQGNLAAMFQAAGSWCCYCRVHNSIALPSPCSRVPVALIPAVFCYCCQVIHCSLF